MIFNDRRDAGQRLGMALARYRGEDAVVLGIPRGGVVVAAEVAKILLAPLDLIIPRKIGAPHNPEVAIGAVAPDGTAILDERMIAVLGIEDREISRLTEEVQAEVARRMDRYRAGRPAQKLTGRVVILVDDGIATGYTVMAALQAIKKAVPAKLVLAVPVAPPDTVKVLSPEADEMVCLASPDNFYAVGQYYTHFEQVEDDEVMAILEGNAGKYTEKVRR
jgi:predicted phosphoribosyltransferase